MANYLIYPYKKVEEMHKVLGKYCEETDAKF